jgi:hypothetical protein
MWCSRPDGAGSEGSLQVSIIRPSCCFPELCPQHRQSRNHDAALLALRRLRESRPGHEEAQCHRAPAQSVKGFAALHNPLTSAKGSEPSGTSEPVAGGDVTALDGLRGVPTAAMHPRAHVAGGRDARGHRFPIRLVRVSNDRCGRPLCARQGLAKKGFRTGPISPVRSNTSMTCPCSSPTRYK